MASIFGHGIVGFTVSKTVAIKHVKWLVVLSILSSILPDVDVLAFNLGIPYAHPLGHRVLHTVFYFRQFGQ